MLKMIIADDESIVRNGLKKNIKWDELGIEVIADAVDGQEALELCEKLHPDILFTDIRMPMMDGLEVAMKLKELKKDIRVVFLSGAHDFNYAKTALDINAEGYVLKPVILEELKDVMKNVVNRINLERSRQSEIIHLKKQLEEHFPIIRESFLKNLICRIYRDELNIQDKIKYFKIPICINEHVVAAVLQIDDYGKITANSSKEDKQLLSFNVSNIIEEVITKHNAGIYCCMNENEFVLIFNQNALNNEKYETICEEISSRVNHCLHLSVSIGIESEVNTISASYSSYVDARTALQYKFYMGKNSILNIKDINVINDIDTESIRSLTLNEKENQLMSYIKLGDCKAVSETVDGIFEQLCSGKNIPINYVQSLCVELISIASRTLRDFGMNLDHIIGRQPEIFEEIYKNDNIYDLKSYISSIFDRIANCFSEKYNQKNMNIVNKIKEIIQQRYNENLSVANISKEVYLTPNYISMIFKRESGETITEYITKIRLEEAKKLLKASDLKIKEIAEMVGYDDPHYFSKVFKNIPGSTLKNTVPRAGDSPGA